MLDRNKIPDLIRRIVDEYLVPSNPKADPHTLFLQALYAVSKIACYNRVKICSQVLDTNGTSPNLYVMSLSRSGSGKDKGKRSMKVLMEDVEKDMRRRQAKSREQMVSDLHTEAELKYESKAQRAAYVKDHEPRSLKVKIDSNGNKEGFYSAREAFFKAGFGCTSWEDSEVFDNITESNAKQGALGGLISSVKKAYDHGETEAKTIKGEKFAYDFEGVPHLTFLHGAMYDDFDGSYIKQFFDLGYARRCLVFMGSPSGEYKRMTVEEKRALAEIRAGSCEDLKGALMDIYDKTNGDFNVCVVEKDAEDLCMEYEEDGDEKAHGLNGRRERGIKADYEGRDWKMLKIAAILAVADSSFKRNIPDVGNGVVIKKEHVGNAIYIVEYFGQYFSSLYLAKGDSAFDKLFEVLSQEPRTLSWIVTETNIIKGDTNQRLRGARSLMNDPAFKEFLEEKGCYLETKKKGSGESHHIKTIPEHKECENVDSVVAHVTLATHAEQTEPRGYVDHTECPFLRLHEYICQDVSWSPCEYKNGYRDGANRIPGEDLLVFDIDNDVDENLWLTIDEASERCKEFIHLIIPTRNHNKEKIDKEGRRIKARPKFRIVFPLRTPMDVSNDEKKNVIELSARELLLTKPKGMCDVAATARRNEAWVPAKLLEAPTYNKKGKLFDWRVAQYRDSVTPTSKGEAANSVPAGTQVHVKGHSKSVGMAEAYKLVANSPQKKLQCHCPLEGHEDKNASAWLSINSKGNMMVCCSNDKCETRFFDI